MINTYICHPFASDPKGNVDKVREICKQIADNSVKQMTAFDRINSNGSRHRLLGSDNVDLPYDGVVVPICPLLLFPEFMSEPDVCREHAMEFCLSLLSTCDEMWVCSDEISEGMQQEIDFCKKHSIPIHIWPYWQVNAN